MADSSNKVLCANAPCKPATLYGKSKLLAEKELKCIAGKHGMQWTIIRPPLVYGPGNPGNMQRLLKLIRSGIPLPLASVRNRRSFIYVENLVDVIVACLGNPKAFGKTYLPSDGEDVSTPELIRKIAKANQSFQCSEFSKQCAGRSTLGSRRTLRLFPFPESILKTLGRFPGLGALRKLTSSLYVDSEPVRCELGWSPRFTMEEGLVKTLGG
jgi:nucleoside-diphosphate-sugar epimerase